MLDQQHILNRFLSYVKIDTESDPNSKTTPSSDKQWILANKLFKELKEIGLSDVSIDENGYIMGTLPSNVDHNVPTIGFISHYDTSPDFTAKNVNPKIIENYNAEDIILNSSENIILSPEYFEDLLLYKGQTLVTTDGTTLLGADDKAGVCEIVSAMEYLIKNPKIKHGTLKVGFTPDEEIGRGAHKFDVLKFGAEWAYTMDGSQIGELEYENFNAASAEIIINGKTYKIWIQIASFSNKKSANILKSKFNSIKNINVKKANFNGKVFYRVRVGPFKKIDETKEIYKFLINSGMEGTKIFVE